MELLQRRPTGLPCRFASRRRPFPAARPGTRLGVIVPSRDNASGSNDAQDMPLLWTHLKKLELEDTYKRAAAEPAYAIQPPEPSVEAPPCSRPDLDAEEVEALAQRRASSTHASTSDHNGSSSWRLSEGDSLRLSEASTRELQAMTGMSLASSHSSHAAINGSSSSAASSNAVTHSSTLNGVSHSEAHAPHATTWHDLAGTRLHQATAPSSSVPTHTHQLTSSLNGASSNGHHSQAPPTSVALREGTGAAPASAAPQAESQPASGSSPSDIPRPIWILCCISAALTCASCVFNTALPVYMVSELKMSMRSMGMFEGLLEAFSYVVRMCSGIVSDRMTSRKAAITLGFAAGAAAKFGMASAGTVGLLFAGKAVDRLANGIQAAPRDALIGDLSPKGVQSACFGLAQSLRKWGSAVGALAAFFLMKASNNNYQLIFYSASAVSLAACIAFVVFVPAHARMPTPAAPAAAAAAAAASTTGAAVGAAVAEGSGKKAGFLHGAKEFLKSVSSMGTDFYRMLGVICMYALGHINESLLEARAMEVGFGKAEATLVVAAIAAVTFMTAYPLGRLDDQYGAGTTFAVGIGALIAGDLVLLLSGTHPVALFVSCMFLGVHWAVIQGPLLSIVSGLAPAHLRGTAFGIFYTVMAVTAVGANTMYGTLWHTYGANAAFATSAALMSVVLLALPHLLPASARKQRAVAAPAAPAPTKGGPSGGAPGLGSPLPAAA